MSILYRAIRPKSIVRILPLLAILVFLLLLRYGNGNNSANSGFTSNPDTVILPCVNSDSLPDAVQADSGPSSLLSLWGFLADMPLFYLSAHTFQLASRQAAPVIPYLKPDRILQNTDGKADLQRLIDVFHRIHNTVLHHRLMRQLNHGILSQSFAVRIQLEIHPLLIAALLNADISRNMLKLLPDARDRFPVSDG